MNTHAPASVTMPRLVAIGYPAAVRVAGAGLLGTMAGIHLHLYLIGYRSIPTIGRLFLLNAVAGAVLAAAMLVTPRRWLPLAGLAGGATLAGTLGALVLSLTVGLFGFLESTKAPLVGASIAVEAAGAALLLGYAAPAVVPMVRTAAGHRRR